MDDFKVEAWLNPEEEKQFKNLIKTGNWGKEDGKGVKAAVVRAAIRDAAEIYTNEDIKDLKKHFPDKSEMDIVRLAIRDLNIELMPEANKTGWRIAKKSK